MSSRATFENENKIRKQNLFDKMLVNWLSNFNTMARRCQNLVSRIDISFLSSISKLRSEQSDV